MNDGLLQGDTDERKVSYGLSDFQTLANSQRVLTLTLIALKTTSLLLVHHSVRSRLDNDFGCLVEGILALFEYRAILCRHVSFDGLGANNLFTRSIQYPGQPFSPRHGSIKCVSRV
jgi:hypothetical protein